MMCSGSKDDIYHIYSILYCRIARSYKHNRSTNCNKSIARTAEGRFIYLIWCQLTFNSLMRHKTFKLNSTNDWIYSFDHTNPHDANKMKNRAKMIRRKRIRLALDLKLCCEVKTRLLKLLNRARAVQQRAGNLISQRLMASQSSSTQLGTSLLPVSAGARPHTDKIRHIDCILQTSVEPSDQKLLFPFHWWIADFMSVSV